MEKREFVVSKVNNYLVAHASDYDFNYEDNDESILDFMCIGYESDKKSLYQQIGDDIWRVTYPSVEQAYKIIQHKGIKYLTNYLFG